MSSANMKKFEPNITVPMSIIKRLKSKGLRWDTWGTPDKTLKGTEKDSLHLTEIVLSRFSSSRAIEEAGPAIRNLIAWRPVMELW